MNVKLKTIEMVNKFAVHLEPSECAVIAVEEIIKAVKNVNDKMKWTKVKEELMKMSKD